jgi:hypothetical protein
MGPEGAAPEREISERSTNMDKNPTHIRSIDHLLKVSPDIPGYGGGQWAMYSFHCCWWTTFPEDLGNTAEILPTTGKLTIKGRNGTPNTEVDFSGLPCCPHCGSVLMQAPLKQFVAAAQENPEHYGKFGIDAFLEAHHRNSKTCHRGWAEYNNDIWRRFNPKIPPTFA